MKVVLALFATAFASLLLLGNTAAAQGIYIPRTVGVDISWPNCAVKKPTGAAFGIVGVNNGQGYTANPCLAKEASYFTNLSLYVNTGWNPSSPYVNSLSPRVCTAGDNNCLSYNYGYNSGIYSFNTAKNAGVNSSMWWLDVETENTWSNDTLQNQNSLQGEIDALKTSGISTIGVYSTTYQWQTITNSWKNGLPNWGATTWTTAKQAAKYCTGHDFTGGGTWLIQFKGKLDQNYAC